MGLSADLETLKASVSRRGGVARSNRYAVYMTKPSGNGFLGNLSVSDAIGNLARSALSGGTTSLGSFLNDPRDMALMCESVQLPSRTIATQERYDDSKAVKMPYATIDDNVSMTFILTNDYYPYKYLKGWQDLVIQKDESYTVAYKEQYASTDIQIQQLGNTDFVPVYGVRLVNAYPVTISAVELSNGSDNTVTRVTVEFAYDYWEETGLIEGAFTALKDGLAGKLVTNIGKLF